MCVTDRVDYDLAVGVCLGPLLILLRQVVVGIRPYWVFTMSLTHLEGERVLAPNASITINRNIIDKDGDYYEGGKSRNIGETKKPKLIADDGEDSRPLRKKIWSEIEDELLRNAVERFGEKAWARVADDLPGRVGKQCRDRWCNHVCPELDRNKWSSEEDEKLLIAVERLGNQWAEISRIVLPGRSDLSIKNRYYSRIRREERRLGKAKRCGYVTDLRANTPKTLPAVKKPTSSSRAAVTIDQDEATTSLSAVTSQKQCITTEGAAMSEGSTSVVAAAMRASSSKPAMDIFASSAAAEAGSNLPAAKIPRKRKKKDISVGSGGDVGGAAKKNTPKKENLKRSLGPAPMSMSTFPLQMPQPQHFMYPPVHLGQFAGSSSSGGGGAALQQQHYKMMHDYDGNGNGGAAHMYFGGGGNGQGLMAQAAAAGANQYWGSHPSVFPPGSAGGAPSNAQGNLIYSSAMQSPLNSLSATPTPTPPRSPSYGVSVPSQAGNGVSNSMHGNLNAAPSHLFASNEMSRTHSPAPPLTLPGTSQGMTFQSNSSMMATGSGGMSMQNTSGVFPPQPNPSSAAGNNLWFAFGGSTGIPGANGIMPGMISNMGGMNAGGGIADPMMVNYLNEFGNDFGGSGGAQSNGAGGGAYHMPLWNMGFNPQNGAHHSGASPAPNHQQSGVSPLSGGVTVAVGGGFPGHYNHSHLLSQRSSSGSSNSTPPSPTDSPKDAHDPLMNPSMWLPSLTSNGIEFLSHGAQSGVGGGGGGGGGGGISMPSMSQLHSSLAMGADTKPSSGVSPAFNLPNVSNWPAAVSTFPLHSSSPIPSNSFEFLPQYQLKSFLLEEMEDPTGALRKSRPNADLKRMRGGAGNDDRDDNATTASFLFPHQFHHMPHFDQQQGSSLPLHLMNLPPATGSGYSASVSPTNPMMGFSGQEIFDHRSHPLHE